MELKKKKILEELNTRIRIYTDEIEILEKEIEKINQIISHLKSRGVKNKKEYIQALMKDMTLFYSPENKWREGEIKYDCYKPTELKALIEYEKCEIQMRKKANILYQKSIDELKKGEKSIEDIIVCLVDKLYVF